MNSMIEYIFAGLLISICGHLVCLSHYGVIYICTSNLGLIVDAKNSSRGSLHCTLVNDQLHLRQCKLFLLL
jgi:hypothetical protein